MQPIWLIRKQFQYYEKHKENKKTNNSIDISEKIKLKIHHQYNIATQ